MPIKLITVPGMAGQAKSMHRVVEALGYRADVTTLGYPDDQALSNDEYLALIRAALPTDGSPYLLLGESFGSQRVYQIASERPVGLMGAVFVVGFLGNPNPVLTQVSNAPQILDNWTNLPSDPGMVATFHGWKGQDAIERMSYLIEEAKRTAPKVTRSRIEIMRTQKVPAGGPLALPSVVFESRHDRLVTKNASARLVSNLTAPTRYMLDGPHFLIHSHPMEIADVIAGFGARLGLS